MNVYDKAHELARALTSSKEYRDYKAAKEKVYKNEQNKKMLIDFKKREFKLQSALLDGRKPSQEEVEQLKKLGELLQYSPDISEYLQAEFRFQRMMADIYKIIGEAVDIKPDFLEEEENNAKQK